MNTFDNQAGAGRTPGLSDFENKAADAAANAAAAAVRPTVFNNNAANAADPSSPRPRVAPSPRQPSSPAAVRPSVSDNKAANAAPAAIRPSLLNNNNAANAADPSSPRPRVAPSPRQPSSPEPRFILCVGPDDWAHADPGRAWSIMRQLSRRHRVLYVDSFAPGSPVAVARRKFIQTYNGHRPTIAVTPRLTQAGERLWRYRPFPAPEGAADLGEGFRLALLLHLACGTTIFDTPPSLLWLADPRAILLSDWLPGLPVVYQVDEPLTERPYVGYRPALQRDERRLLDRADRIVCGSRSAYLRLARPHGDRVRYLPPAIDLARFTRLAATTAATAVRPTVLNNNVADATATASAVSSSPPLSAPFSPRPRVAPSPRQPLSPAATVGVPGPLTSSYEVKLVNDCRARLPDVSFLILAQAATPDRPIARRRLDPPGQVRVRPDHWPAALAACDVLFLPTAPASWPARSTPASLLPLLASGRPIVSTPLPEVLFLAGDCVAVAATPADLCAAIRRAIAEDSPRQAARRRSIAAAHDWPAVIGRLEAMLPGPPAAAVDPWSAFVDQFAAWKRRILPGGRPDPGACAADGLTFNDVLMALSIQDAIRVCSLPCGRPAD